MDEHTLTVLEFDKIKNMLSCRCLSDWGKELCRCLSPGKDRETVEKEQRETTELRDILRYEERFPLTSIKDIRQSLKKGEIEGTRLEPKELLDIGETLAVSRALLKFIKPREEKYPNIFGLVSQLRSFDQIQSAINKAVDQSGEIKDSASGRLSDVRHQKKTVRNRLLDKLESMIGARKIKGPRQDDIITMRDGRYVIPMDEADFFQQRGIVHDKSKSGATLFVEPLVAVGLNNQLRELTLEEDREIDKILKEITDMIRAELPDLKITVKALQRLDFVYAKGKLSSDYEGTPPVLNEQGYINLIQARHPLLDFSSGSSQMAGAKEEGEEKRRSAVPLSLSLGKEYTTLIITGPNTGGKTVALKTVGLLTLMALSGLHLPAQPHSEICLFKKIYADIGDEQSIEMSVSTFSSHMRGIKKAIQDSDSETLVLLDELGGGTDPKEGVALGEAIIDQLIKKEAKVIVTTHHGALKILAEEYPQIRNASLEFDKETLTPTYHFQIGYPGSSYAIEIAQRLGMPREVIEKAQKLVGSKERNLGLLLESLEKDLKTVRENRKALDQKMKVSDELVNLYKDKVEKLESKEKDLKTNALREAKHMVETTRVELERLIAQIRKTQAEKQVVKEAHHVLEDKKVSIEKELEEFEEKIVRRLGIVQPGDAVWIERLGVRGDVLEKDEHSGRIKVLAGDITYTVEESELTRIEDAEKVEGGSEYMGTQYTIPHVSPEVDLRGLLAEEAFDVVDKYLDNAYLAGLSQVSLIHGKGTGALRKKIGEFLGHHHRVEEFRLGEYDEGGSGVTIVKLKE
jgi:DNA mismatch repair protein MutS2